MKDKKGENKEEKKVIKSVKEQKPVEPGQSQVPQVLQASQEVKLEKTKKLSKDKQLLALLMNPKADKSESALAGKLGMDVREMYDLAEKLEDSGYTFIRSDTLEGKSLTLYTGQEDDDEITQISFVNRRVRVAIVPEPRFGSDKAQISLMHWLYEVDFPKKDINFAVIAGGLVTVNPKNCFSIKGQSLAQDTLASLRNDGKILANYVIKHFPRSKTFKTHIIASASELSWGVRTGFDITSLICSSRDDLVKAGTFRRTFDVNGVRIKVMAPYSDNSPLDIGNGPRKLADKCKDDPKPTVLYIGGMHRRSEFPDYNGMVVVTGPCMHRQTIWQERKGISPRVGYTIIELNFDENGKLDESVGLKIWHSRLDDYVVPHDCYSIDMSLASKLDDVSKKVLEWFSKKRIISAGELSRRLKISKDSVKKIIEKIRKCGYEIEFKEDAKSYELNMKEKEKFSPLSLKYEDVYVFAAKEAALSDRHLNHKSDRIEVTKKAHEDAKKAGVSRIFDAGDLTDGPGAIGYRGHQNDVKFASVVKVENYVVSIWPKTEIEVDPKRPITISERFDYETGEIGYRDVKVSKGKVPLQTFVIEGNHDGWTFKSVGHLIVRAIAIRLGKFMRYVGNMEGAVICDGIYHKLVHPTGSGGGSNEIERHLKKIRETEEAGDLPAYLLLGHRHSRAYFLFDQRAGEFTPSGKAEDDNYQTMGIMPVIGMSIKEMYLDKTGKNFTMIVFDFRNYYKLANPKSTEERL